MTLPRSLTTILLACAIQQAVLAFQPMSPPTLRTPATAQLAVALPTLSLPDLFGSKDARRSQLKDAILDLASETKRGLTATEEQRGEMEQLFESLEALNPTADPLVARKGKPSVNGDWDLRYTTSDSILGKGGFPRVGPIVQNIDTTTLSAKNSETVRYAVLDVPRSVTSELAPVDGKLTNVQFKRFALGPIGFDAPDKFKGSLDITYLDDDMRLTRGDKGNIFVLTRL
ncbi:hypothetical protein ACHAWF_008728 [Thalassiosira exigua]